MVAWDCTCNELSEKASNASLLKSRALSDKFWELVLCIELLISHHFQPLNTAQYHHSCQQWVHISLWCPGRTKESFPSAKAVPWEMLCTQNTTGFITHILKPGIPVHQGPQGNSTLPASVFITAIINPWGRRGLNQPLSLAKPLYPKLGKWGGKQEWRQ